MKKKSGFTLMELLVVIAIIALLMAMLMPALSAVRQRAKSVVCQTKLKNWAYVFEMYCEANKGRFPAGFQGKDAYGNLASDPPHNLRAKAWIWHQLLRPYYGDNNDLLLCPMANKVDLAEWNGGDAFTPWKQRDMHEVYTGVIGSYGINHYTQQMQITASGNVSVNASKYWTKNNLSDTARVPLLYDCQRDLTKPAPQDVPPPYEGYKYRYKIDSGNRIRKVCKNRHNRHINMLFMDASVRKVGLKELWELKWHGSWDKERAAAGCPIWPEWMKSYKGYASD